MKAYLKKAEKPGFYFVSRFYVPGSVPCTYTKGFKFLVVATDDGIFRISYEKVIF